MSGTEAQNETGKSALSVSAAMAQAKGALESVVVRIVGEVSEVNVRPGYKAAYFTVKDSAASLPCMMWNNRYKASGIDLVVGRLVEITGRFTLYAAKGRMNFDVFAIELAGEGDLRLKVANIAKRLQAEGLTDPARKRPLPPFPESIGLVTSPRSAAVHDVLRTLRRRFPLATVYLAGVPVEGASAAEGIVEGMRCVYRMRPEVILIVRGGGSFEDLMPFNDEGLARAIAKCDIPVVTGIGHEVDTTIADMVSDYRASTPTAAAEAISPSRESLDSLFASRASELSAGVSRHLDRTRSRVEGMASRPVFADPVSLFVSEGMALDNAAERMVRALPQNIDRMAAAVESAGSRLQRALPARMQISERELDSMRDRLVRVLPVMAQREGRELEGFKGRLGLAGEKLCERFGFELAHAASRLADLSPVNTLARGFSITRDGEGRVVRHVEEVPVGANVTVTLSDGMIECLVRGSETGDPLSLQKGA